MKTLADFKRKMKVGSLWYRKHWAQERAVLRTVIKVCSDHVYVKEIHSTQAIRLDFPKASEFAINENGQAEIYNPATYTYKGVERIDIPRKLVLTYNYLGEKSDLDRWDMVEP